MQKINFGKHVWGWFHPLFVFLRIESAKQEMIMYIVPPEKDGLLVQDLALILLCLSTPQGVLGPYLAPAPRGR